MESYINELSGVRNFLFAGRLGDYRDAVILDGLSLTERLIGKTGYQEYGLVANNHSKSI